MFRRHGLSANLIVSGSEGPGPESGLIPIARGRQGC
jgi:hypothetical protein